MATVTIRNHTGAVIISTNVTLNTATPRPTHTHPSGDTIIMSSLYYKFIDLYP